MGIRFFSQLRKDEDFVVRDFMGLQLHIPGVLSIFTLWVMTALHFPSRCETNCKPVNASEEVVLSVTSQKGPEAMRYNWYLDNTFHAKVRLSRWGRKSIYTQTVWLDREPLEV